MNSRTQYGHIYSPQERSLAPSEVDVQIQQSIQTDLDKYDETFLSDYENVFGEPFELDTP
jgi:hypothetical protein